MSELAIVLAILCIAATYESLSGKDDGSAALVSASLFIGALVLGILGTVYG